MSTNINLNLLKVSSIWARLGLLATFSYSFFKVNSNDIARVSAIVMVLLGFWFIYRHNKRLFLSFGFFLLGASFFIQITSWLISLITHIELASSVPKFDDLSRIFLFLPIAWWLGGNTKKTLMLWSIASVGAMVSPWISGEGFTELYIGLKGQRIDFNISNAQHTSLIFGCVLIGSIVLFKRFTQGWRHKWIAWMIWTAAILFSFTIVIFTQTRAVWLGLCAACVVGVICFLRAQKFRFKTQQVWPVAAVIVLVTIAASVSPIKNIIIKRALIEKEVFLSIISGDEITSLPDSSAGVRVKSWKAGISLFTEKPLFGWGSNGKSIAISHNDWLSSFVKSNFNHLHNTYIELLVNYGLIGMFFYVLVFLWMMLGAIKSKNNGSLPDDIFLFFMLFTIFWSVANFFESFLFYSTGVFLLSIVFGGVLTHVWSNELRHAEVSD